MGHWVFMATMEDRGDLKPRSIIMHGWWTSQCKVHMMMENDWCVMEYQSLSKCCFFIQIMEYQSLSNNHYPIDDDGWRMIVFFLQMSDPRNQESTFHGGPEPVNGLKRSLPVWRPRSSWKVGGVARDQSPVCLGNMGRSIYLCLYWYWYTYYTQISCKEELNTLFLKIANTFVNKNQKRNHPWSLKLGSWGWGQVQSTLPAFAPWRRQGPQPSDLSKVGSRWREGANLKRFWQVQQTLSSYIFGFQATNFKGVSAFFKGS